MIEDEIAKILFRIGSEIKMHKIDNDNFIIEIDYEKYVKEIMELLNEKQ